MDFSKENLNELQLVRTLLRNTPMIFYVIDSNRIFRLSEGKGLEALGLKAGQVVGLSVNDVYSEDYEMLNTIEKAFQGESITMHSHVDDIHYESYILPFFNDSHQVEGIIGVANDISLRKKAEQELLELNRTLEEKVLERTYELKEANKNLEQTNLEILSKNEELNALNQELTSMNEEVTAMNEQLHDNNQKMLRMQRQLVEAEKMVALGTLVAGVAHEVNTPIGISVTASSHLSDIAKEIIAKKEMNKTIDEELDFFFEDLQLATDIIQKNLSRAGNLVQSFKQLSVDQSSEEKRVFDLGNYLDEIIVSLSPSYKNSKIKVIKNYPQGIIFNGWPGAFAQIITNLLFNSMHHGFNKSDSGTIEISATKTDASVTIVFKDSGMGMSKEVLKHIFDPFFTTKRTTGGTGLGLSIVYSLVTQKFFGTIKCESELGSGTSFTIVLPTGGENNE